MGRKQDINNIENLMKGLKKNTLLVQIPLKITI